MPATLNNTGVLFNDSSQQSSAYLGHRISLFTSSSTFTPPAGVTQLKITAIGGGGSGGGWDGIFVRYAGAGACAIALVTVTGGTTYLVTIGSGAIGSNPNFTSFTGEDGANGGETWFGVNSGSKLISAGGGTGTTASWAYYPPTCCFGGGTGVSGATSGVDGTSSTTGTLLRSGDGISSASSGNLTWGTISGSAINWGLSYQLFGSSTRSVNTSGSTTAVVWTASSDYFPGQGGRTATNGGAFGGQTNASAGVGGVMIIEY